MRFLLSNVTILLVCCNALLSQSWQEDSIVASDMSYELYKTIFNQDKLLAKQYIDSMESIYIKHNQPRYLYDILHWRKSYAYTYESFEKEELTIYKLDSLIDYNYSNKIDSSYYPSKKADIYYSLGFNKRNTYDFKSALSFLHKGIGYLDKKVMHIMSFENYFKVFKIQLGQTYEDLGRYSEALRSYQEYIDEELYNAKSGDRPPEIKGTQGRIANILVKEKKYTRAYPILYLALNDYDDLLNKNPDLINSYKNAIGKHLVQLIETCYELDKKEEIKTIINNFENLPSNNQRSQFLLTLAKYSESKEEALSFLNDFDKKVASDNIPLIVESKLLRIKLQKNTYSCEDISQLLFNEFNRIDSSWAKSTFLSKTNNEILKSYSNLIYESISLQNQCPLISSEIDLNTHIKNIESFVFDSLYHDDQLISSNHLLNIYNLQLYKSIKSNNAKEAFWLADKTKGIILNRLNDKNQDDLIKYADVERRSSSRSFLHYLSRFDNMYAIKLYNRNYEIINLGKNNEQNYLATNYTITQDSFTNNKFKYAFENLFQDVVVSEKDNIVFPDGFLHNIPFESFALNSNINIQRQFSIQSSPKETRSKSNKICLYAPEYESAKGKDDKLFAVRTPSGQNMNLTKLVYAKEEAENIINITNSTCNISTPKDFVESIQSNKAIHFSGHAISSFNEPNGAFIAIHTNADSIQLSLNEIYSLQSKNSMVVLSSCQSGVGKYIPGEGPLSLARAFMYSGAKSVISTLWSVNDKSTSIIMSEFYKELLKGKRKDEALRQAKLTYLDHADPEYKHPYYWAGFIAMGDMSPLFFPQRKWYYVGLGLLGFLIIGFIVKKKISSSRLAA